MASAAVPAAAAQSRISQVLVRASSVLTVHSAGQVALGPQIVSKMLGAYAATWLPAQNTGFVTAAARGLGPGPVTLPLGMGYSTIQLGAGQSYRLLIAVDRPVLLRLPAGLTIRRIVPAHVRAGLVLQNAALTPGQSDVAVLWRSNTLSWARVLSTAMDVYWSHEGTIASKGSDACPSTQQVSTCTTPAATFIEADDTYSFYSDHIASRYQTCRAYLDPPSLPYLTGQAEAPSSTPADQATFIAFGMTGASTR